MQNLLGQIFTVKNTRNNDFGFLMGDAFKVIEIECQNDGSFFFYLEPTLDCSMSDSIWVREEIFKIAFGFKNQKLEDIVYRCIAFNNDKNMVIETKNLSDAKKWLKRKCAEGRIDWKNKNGTVWLNVFEYNHRLGFKRIKNAYGHYVRI